jgi:hypothetical protein
MTLKILKPRILLTGVWTGENRDKWDENCKISFLLAAENYAIRNQFYHIDNIKNETLSGLEYLKE